MVITKDFPVPLWKRVAAYIVDSFIISFIVVQPFMSKIESAKPENMADFFQAVQGTFFKDMFLLSLVIGSLTLLYWTFLEYKYGQTIGKILLQIKVQGEKKKQKPTVLQIVTRNITKLSTLLIILDTFYMLFKKSNQRYFEKLSKTRVTREVPIIQ